MPVDYPELQEGIIPDANRGAKAVKIAKFDPKHQYGDWVALADNKTETLENAKSIMLSQMKAFVPAKFHHLVVWLEKHFESESFRIKEDNYEMFGLTKDKIGTLEIMPEQWTLAWKYTPERN